MHLLQNTVEKSSQIFHSADGSGLRGFLHIFGGLIAKNFLIRWGKNTKC